jgi:hypothetical protein
MENDRLASDVANELSASETQASSGLCYLETAPLIAVLFEQLEYLATHLTKSDDCPSPCPVCARLGQVTRDLLVPFRDKL